MFVSLVYHFIHCLFGETNSLSQLLVCIIYSNKVPVLKKKLPAFQFFLLMDHGWCVFGFLNYFFFFIKNNLRWQFSYLFWQEIWSWWQHCGLYWSFAGTSQGWPILRWACIWYREKNEGEKCMGYIVYGCICFFGLKA